MRVMKWSENDVWMSQYHKSITGYKILTLISAREWLSLQADAF